MPAAPFGDRVAAAVARRRSQVVLGIDPDPERLWPEAVEAGTTLPGASAGERAATAVRVHCEALIEAAAPACVAAKLQLACFERLGARGWGALAAVAARARAAGLLVVADGKRGDIDVSARAYGQALVGATSTPFGEVPGLGADAVTANPFLGEDALGALVDVARAAGAGVFVLVRTSNPGAAAIQDRELVGGGSLAECVAASVGALGHPGPESRLADVGAVVGATAPDRLVRLRELMPHAVLLLPGVGAQGGRVDDLAAAFAPGSAGGLVSASRSIADAHRAGPGTPAQAARAEVERLRARAWELASAGAQARTRARGGPGI